MGATTLNCVPGFTRVSSLTSQQLCEVGRLVSTVPALQSLLQNGETEARDFQMISFTEPVMSSLVEKKPLSCLGTKG